MECKRIIDKQLKNDIIEEFSDALLFFRDVICPIKLQLDLFSSEVYLGGILEGLNSSLPEIKSTINTILKKSLISWGKAPLGAVKESRQAALVDGMESKMAASNRHEDNFKELFWNTLKYISKEEYTKRLRITKINQ
ncbi:hypothetical protein TNCV_3186641 [Trichonephila clavipes]|nr:hypothetical protein TNCV_3186641 [Trichonephila clavipes]